MAETSTEGATPFGEATWDLPPLILHPFAGPSGPDLLMKASQAALILGGFLPQGDLDKAELDRRLMAGRFHELRMLYFVGKDLFRWMSQCVEFAGRDTGLAEAHLTEQSFAMLLTRDVPPNVDQKLKTWGVSDYQGVFSRAIGLNTIFADAPGVEALAESFLRHHGQYADQIFPCWMKIGANPPITTVNFRYELYASGEYSRLLETEWAEE